MMRDLFSSSSLRSGHKNVKFLMHRFMDVLRDVLVHSQYVNNITPKCKGCFARFCNYFLLTKLGLKFEDVFVKLQDAPPGAQMLDLVKASTKQLSKAGARLVEV